MDNLVRRKHFSNSLCVHNVCCGSVDTKTRVCNKDQSSPSRTCDLEDFEQNI